MTSGLRKAHQFIWILLLISVPVIMYVSVKDLSFFSSEENSLQFTSLKKTRLQSFENDIVNVSVFETHIEMILKTTLKNSSSVVYTMDENGNKSHVVGQLTTVGIYKFNINELPKGLIIYDDLKGIEITKFLF